MTGSVSKGVRAVAWGCGFALLMLVATWLRLSRYAEILPGGDLLPNAMDGDAAYHLHRILAAARDFPHVPYFDPWMNWPYGAYGHFSDGFDVLGAGFARLMAAGRGGDALALAALLWPVALGLLVVWAAMALARQLAPAARRGQAAMVAGIAVVAAPQAIEDANLGRTDHHVAEALFMLVVGSWLMAAPPPDAPQQRRLMWEGAGALLIGGFVWIFAGAPLYLALAAGPLALRALLAPARPRVGSGILAFAAGAALAFLLSAPSFEATGQRWSFQYPSYLQPALLVGMAMAIGAPILLRRGFPAMTATRAVLLTSAVISSAVVAVFWAPGIGPAVRGGVTHWLFHRDRWMSTINEVQPFFGERLPVGAGIDRVVWGIGGFGLIFPLTALVAIVGLGRRDRWRGAALAFVLAALLGLTLIQGRFGRSLSPWLGVTCALALAHLSERVATRAPRLGRIMGPLAVTSAVVLALVNPQVVGALKVAPPTRDLAMALALDLRDAPHPRERPGILARWDWGHQLRVVGETPVVNTGFGTLIGDEAGFWEANDVLGRSEAELYALMDRRRLGFVAAGFSAWIVGDESWLTNGVMRKSKEGEFLFVGREFMAKVALAPLLIGGSGMPERSIHHLERLRPRWATQNRFRTPSSSMPELWNYELVQGARLVGTARPGARVIAELPFSEHGYQHVWRAWCDVGSDGRWSMTVPFPSDYASPVVQSGARWSAYAGGGTVRFRVSEQAVSDGATVEVGALPR